MKKTSKYIILLGLLTIVTGCSYSAFGSDEVDTTTSASPTTENQETLPIVKNPLSRTETLLHTAVQIQIYHEGQEAVMDEAFNYMTEMEQLMSTNLEGSDVYRINQAAGQEAVEVSSETFEIIERALQVAEESDGLFDITIGALTNLWQIGSEDARVPSQEEIDEAVSKIDYRKVTLDPENLTVKLEEEGMAIELGGISKGYIGSGVANLFQEQGITTAIINLGGNVVVMGTSPSNEDGWNVGVQDPDEERGEVVGSQRVTNGAVVTSGIYERYFEHEGQKYHHIMDPRTGYPLDNEISGVTVFAPTSFEADSYSTALFLMGIEEGLNFVNNREGLEAVFIDKDKGVHLSDGIKDTFDLSNEEYHIANE